MVDMPLEEFQKLVDEAVLGIPEEFRKRLENVDILVEIWPSDPHTSLFGLYRGVPKTKRGLYYSGVLPDKITIFMGPILSLSKGEEEVKLRIRSTVIHEIGHYFGMSEEAIRRAEKERM